MAKNKLQRFAELRTFPNAHQFLWTERETDFKLKGKWNSDHFKNTNPIVLELGCGKGEYSVGLGEKYPEKNFIGVDLKGNRLWRGCKNAMEKKLDNVCFLRTQIEYIDKCFAKDEVSEIWITFPDPQPNKERKRLTHPLFLNRYRNILKPGGIVHLKTDSAELHEFTLEVMHPSPALPKGERVAQLLFATKDLYASPSPLPFGEEGGVSDIKTHYEKLFSDKGKKITYLKFLLQA